MFRKTNSTFRKTQKTANISRLSLAFLFLYLKIKFCYIQSVSIEYIMIVGNLMKKITSNITRNDFIESYCVLESAVLYKTSFSLY